MPVKPFDDAKAILEGLPFDERDHSMAGPYTNYRTRQLPGWENSVIEANNHGNTVFFVRLTRSVDDPSEEESQSEEFRAIAAQLEKLFGRPPDTTDTTSRFGSKDIRIWGNYERNDSGAQEIILDRPGPHINGVEMIFYALPQRTYSDGSKSSYTCLTEVTLVYYPEYELREKGFTAYREKKNLEYQIQPGENVFFELRGLGMLNTNEKIKVRGVAQSSSGRFVNIEIVTMPESSITVDSETYYKGDTITIPRSLTKREK